jgi:dimethylargininase
MDIALTRDVSPAINEAELTFLEREPIDYWRAATQHALYCEALSSLGLHVLRLPADPDCPDCCFVEDNAVVLDEVAVLAAPTPASRRPELPIVEAALAQFRDIVRLPPGAHLEGGDVLRIGRTLYAGLSSRTNAAGIDALRMAVDPFGYGVVAVPVRGCLHLKTAVTAVSDDAVLANPGWADLAALSGLSVIPVASEEPFAANVLRVGDALLAHAGFPRTNGSLERQGFTVRTLDLSEFAKAEAGVTCKSIVFRAP